MARVLESVLMPFEASKIYEIVNDVGSYSEFLPWCIGSKVIEEDDESMRASITIRKGGFSYSLTTNNRLVFGRSISLEFSEGPFKYLKGAWSFDTTESGCQVRLELDFEAENKLLDIALNAASKPVATTLMRSFRNRAFELLG